MNKCLGILGGGQLGRMLALAARPLGLWVVALDPSELAPARAAARMLIAPYDDDDALAELSRSDWVTFEFENIPDRSAELLSRSTQVAPPPEALRVSQDRYTEKTTFQRLGIPTAEFVRVDSLEQARDAFDQLGPIVLKTRRFGYDGKGQARALHPSDVEAAYESLGGESAIAEALVPFDRELSVIVCRARDGAIVVYPLTQNVHRHGILHKSVAPAPDLTPELAAQAEAAVTRLADHLKYVGVLTLELFQVGSLLIANEFAPRVHNSGHWTIEGAITSQFENHVRAVTGLPLGSTRLRSPAVMINLIGKVPPLSALLAVEDCHVHDYEKEPRDQRKVGHVTCLGATPEEAQSRSSVVESVIEAETES